MFPNACVSISFRAICFPILLHIYTLEKTYCTHQSFSIVIYISHTTVGKSTSQLFSITSYLFFLIAVLHQKEKKEKKGHTQICFFFVSFFLSVILKKTILIVLTVSFCHRLLCITHLAMLSLRFLRFCKRDKTGH